ncbi:hypothetical protein JW758_05945 [Candidatus Peregrinibacteria bacterium]|nr:hypothetical protein [Candidatus Peregrinibacteria bacterium]
MNDNIEKISVIGGERKDPSADRQLGFLRAYLSGKNVKEYSGKIGVIIQIARKAVEAIPDTTTKNLKKAELVMLIELAEQNSNGQSLFEMIKMGINCIRVFLETENTGMANPIDEAKTIILEMNQLISIAKLAGLDYERYEKELAEIIENNASKLGDLEK